MLLRCLPRPRTCASACEQVNVSPATKSREQQLWKDNTDSAESSSLLLLDGSGDLRNRRDLMEVRLGVKGSVRAGTTQQQIPWLRITLGVSEGKYTTKQHQGKKGKDSNLQEEQHHHPIGVKKLVFSLAVHYHQHSYFMVKSLGHSICLQTGPCPFPSYTMQAPVNPVEVCSQLAVVLWVKHGSNLAPKWEQTVTAGSPATLPLSFTQKHFPSPWFPDKAPKTKRNQLPLPQAFCFGFSLAVAC